MMMRMKKTGEQNPSANSQTTQQQAIEYLRAGPAQGISELINCLGPPWPPQGPQEHMKLQFYVFLNIHILTMPRGPQISIA